MSTPLEELLKLAGSDRERLETVLAVAKHAYDVALRDHFAGLAIGALIDPDTFLYGGPTPDQFRHLAERTYEIADAMLAERKRGGA